MANRKDNELRIAEAEFNSSNLSKGLEHPDTLDAMMRLASIQVRHGNYGDAEKVLELELKTRAKALGEGDYGHFAVAHRLGDALFWQGKLRKGSVRPREDPQHVPVVLRPNFRISTISALNNFGSNI